jgi:hypothetical protein
MQLATTRKLLEQRLAALSPSLPTAWENVEFKPPNGKYLMCSIKLGEPDDRNIGCDYYREEATLNVYICDKLGIGPSSAFETAESVRALFNKGLTLEESNVKITILVTPRIAGGAVTTDRYVVPVVIKAMVEVL